MNNIKKNINRDYEVINFFLKIFFFKKIKKVKVIETGSLSNIYEFIIICNTNSINYSNSLLNFFLKQSKFLLTNFSDSNFFIDKKSLNWYFLSFNNYSIHIFSENNFFFDNLFFF